MQSGLLSRPADEESPRFAPARPLSSIRVKAVLDALRVPQGSTRMDPIRNVDDALELWQELDRAAGEAAGNRTLAELVAAAP